MTPLLKAIGIGASVFVATMLVFWLIARLAGRPFSVVPSRLPAAPSALPTPTPPLPFLR